MIVHINSYPGVGKFTIGRALADLIGARLLDNHSVFNVAFALTESAAPPSTTPFARCARLPTGKSSRFRPRFRSS